MISTNNLKDVMYSRMTPPQKKKAVHAVMYLYFNTVENTTQEITRKLGTHRSVASGILARMIVPGANLKALRMTYSEPIKLPT